MSLLLLEWRQAFGTSNVEERMLKLVNGIQMIVCSRLSNSGHSISILLFGFKMWLFHQVHGAVASVCRHKPTGSNLNPGWGSLCIAYLAAPFWLSSKWGAWESLGRINCGNQRTYHSCLCLGCRDVGHHSFRGQWGREEHQGHDQL